MISPLSCTAGLFLSIAVTTVPALSIPLSTRASNSSITWSNCTDAHPWLPPNLQCASLSVPIDWEAPETSKTFDLGIVRLPRTTNSTTERIGNLFLNPGGPGNSATQLVANIADGFETVSPDILNSFDLIGVDPRGVEQSSRLQCDADIWNTRVSLFPKTREDYDRLVDHNKRLGESCLNLTGEIVNHLDTLSAAKDHEAVRAALGEDMNWLGLSYGTQLGSQYAELFPDNIRAMVLDGVLQHSQSESSNILIEATTYAAELALFFEWAGTNKASPLEGQDVEQLWYGLLQNATDTPIPAPDCEGRCREDVTEEEIRLNAQGLLITATDESRIRFANALIAASEGDASALSTPTFWEGAPSGYPGLGIGCQDWSTRASSFEDLQAKMRIGEFFAPLTKGASQTWTLQASCIGWPAPLANPPKKLNVQTQAPILMVNSIRDPSTSYAWAVGMLEEIENGVLLTRNGDGHTSWSLGGATADIINHFLITAELPVAGTVINE